MTAALFTVNVASFCLIWSWISLIKSLQLEQILIFNALWDALNADHLCVCVSVCVRVHTQHTLTSNKRYLSGSFTQWRSDYERLNH